MRRRLQRLLGQKALDVPERIEICIVPFFSLALRSFLLQLAARLAAIVQARQNLTMRAELLHDLILVGRGLPLDVALHGGQSVSQVCALLLLGLGEPRAYHRNFVLRQRAWRHGVEGWCLARLQHGRDARKRQRGLCG